jgi:hypothetical protein
MLRAQIGIDSARREWHDWGELPGQLHVKQNRPGEKGE